MFALGITLANFTVRYQLKVPSGRLFQRLTSQTAGLIYCGLGGFIIIYFMNKVSTSPDLFFRYYLSKVPVSVGFTLLIAGVTFGAN